MKGALGDLMKQAQAMQEGLRRAQEELAKVEVTGTAGGGVVDVTMNCRHDVKRIRIDPSLLQDDKEVLEDLLAAAVNDAVRKVEKATQEKLSGLTGGLSVPGLKLPL